MRNLKAAFGICSLLLIAGCGGGNSPTSRVARHYKLKDLGIAPKSSAPGRVLTPGNLFDLGSAGQRPIFGPGVGFVLNNTDPTTNATTSTYYPDNTGKGVDLGAIAQGYKCAYAVNAAGTVVGVTATTTNPGKAVSWTNNGSPTPLADLGGTSSIALGIDSAGDIVGGSTTPADGGYDRAFLLPAGSKTAIDLNTLIPSDSGWFLAWGERIDDSGNIVGVGRIVADGSLHYFLLTPVQ